MYSMICEICKKEFETEAPLDSVLISLDGIESACGDCRYQHSIGGAKRRYQKLWHDRIDEFADDIKEADSFFDSLDFKRMFRDYVGELFLRLFSSKSLSKKLKAKFDKGMAEHGMGFESVDFDAEIENEILDICNYFIGKHYSKKEKENV